MGYYYQLPMLSKKSLKSNRKPNKIWVHIGSEFHDRSMKSFLQNNDTEMYSTDNKEKSFIAERFLGTLKNNIYNYVT